MSSDYNMNSLSIARIVKDLEGKMRLDKIYLIDDNMYSFKFYRVGSGSEEWVYNVGKWICRTEYDIPKPKTPPPKIMALRRSIGEIYVEKVYQKGFERIIVIEGKSSEKKEDIRIILELFGDGNLIVEKSNKIIYAHYHGAWRHREIKLGIPYVFPPERPNVREISLKEFKELAEKSSKDLVRFLAVEMGLGGELAEEVCARASIEKNKKVNMLTEKELESVLTTIKGIIEECEKSEKAYVYLQGEKIISIAPIRFTIYEKSMIDIKEFESIHKAIEEFALKPYLTREHEIKEVKEKIEKKYSMILRQQREALERLISKAESYRKIADKAYEYFSELNMAFEIIKDAFKKNNLEILNKIRNMGILKELNTRENYVVINVPKGGFSIKLYLNKSIHESISEYYSRAKDCEERAKRLQKTIEDIKRKMKDELEKAKVQMISKKRKERRFWFEKYKWFISSSGHIVIAGRDARTNEEVVRRYLDEKDLYAHADIHGAPSVVIKSLGKDIDKDTIREACEFAVLHSRAWGRIYMADAYWVYPHQVTKTPNPGEYLPLGAFVIKGKRNYIYNLEIKCGIGLVNVEGYEKLMCGPVSAVKRHSSDYLIIAPGDIDKNIFANAVAEAYGFDVSYVLSILPPGNVEILEYYGERARRVWEKFKGRST
ncbi:MAG: NFACT family protein [Euryarchaeota archaeon]|nr:NFACT family protein [Euryarchaeota archaeon]